MSVADITLIIGGLITLVGAIREWTKARSEQKIREEDADTARYASEVAITERMRRIADGELQRYSQRMIDLETEVSTLKRRISEINDSNDALVRQAREMMIALEEYFAHRCEAFTATGDMCITCLRADVQFIEHLRTAQGSVPNENMNRLENLLTVKKQQLEQKLREESKTTRRRRT